MRLIRLPLPPPLPRYIHQMWLFESDVGLPPGDLRTVVPTGRTRLILTLRGHLTALGAGRSWTVSEGRAAVVGQWDRPAVLSSPPQALVTLGVEFTPAGLAILSPAPLGRITGEIVPLADVAERLEPGLLSRVTSAETPLEAARLLQAGLLACARARTVAGETLAEATIRLMSERDFGADMADLERLTGYSRRYLSAVFQRDVGLSPARTQAILGFEALYRDFARHGVARRLVDDALDRFHDQSHFSRVFKRFTGLPPARFAQVGNRFGRLFYEQT